MFILAIEEVCECHHLLAGKKKCCAVYCLPIYDPNENNMEIRRILRGSPGVPFTSLKAINPCPKL